jgi:hypothetical protein
LQHCRPSFGYGYVRVWTVKDGRVTAFSEYEGDQQGDDEFWSLHP